ncbi:MAG: hypothetical protein PHE83_05715 [Opitutaceae bacterium]|nr:hypothetical protein [Opitutaceae bacterium]
MRLHLQSIDWLTPQEREERRLRRQRLALIIALSFTAGVNAAVWSVTWLLR